jgi:hypothetical protein
LTEEYLIGLEHSVNDPPSREHSRPPIPTPPESVPVNVNSIEVEEVLSLFSNVWLLPSVTELMELNGGIVSTTQVKDIGDDLTFPTLSLDNIFKL